MWASADSPEFPEVTPPDALSYSALCPRLLQPYAACRPAKPSACPLKTGTTPPGGKAAVSLRLRRADRNGHRKWTRISGL